MNCTQRIYINKNKILNGDIMDKFVCELQKRVDEVAHKWKTKCNEEYGGNFNKWYRQNIVEIQNDISDLLFLEKLQGVSVVKEDGGVVASTDFTDESKNLEVWKAIGLQEEDFYNT